MELYVEKNGFYLKLWKHENGQWYELISEVDDFKGWFLSDKPTQDLIHINELDQYEE